MFDQNDSSTKVPANARPELANKCLLLHKKVDELDIIMKQNTIFIGVITEMWFQRNTLNLGIVKGKHSYCRKVEVGICFKETIPVHLGT